MVKKNIVQTPGVKTYRKNCVTTWFVRTLFFFLVLCSKYVYFAFQFTACIVSRWRFVVRNNGFSKVFRRRTMMSYKKNRSRSWGKKFAPKNLFNAVTPDEDKVSKYGVDISEQGKKDRTSGGRVFASLREKDRYHTLIWRCKLGEITNLKIQQAFRLELNEVLICTYIADFVYYEDGERIVEDCKGVRTGEYKIKRNLMLAILGINIKES